MGCGSMEKNHAINNGVEKFNPGHGIWDNEILSVQEEG